MNAVRTTLIGRCFAGLFALAVILISGPAFAQALEGNYNVSGTNPSGGVYTGKVVIRAIGKNKYKLSWLIATSGETYVGTGPLQGDTLTIYWGKKYPVIYKVGDDGVLQGAWDNGAGTEVLVPER